jgi:hypothetical protein
VWERKRPCLEQSRRCHCDNPGNRYADNSTLLLFKGGVDEMRCGAPRIDRVDFLTLLLQILGARALPR